MLPLPISAPHQGLLQPHFFLFSKVRIWQHLSEFFSPAVKITAVPKRQSAERESRNLLLTLESHCLTVCDRVIFSICALKALTKHNPNSSGAMTTWAQARIRPDSSTTLLTAGFLSKEPFNVYRNVLLNCTWLYTERYFQRKALMILYGVWLFTLGWFTTKVSAWSFYRHSVFARGGRQKWQLRNSCH